jgi:outer membrane receptor protein involved in Fe transport
MSKTWARVARRTALTLAGVAALWGEGAGGAHAADSTINDEDRLQEIVVTATRREERIQDIPISIAAFTGEQLAKQGADNFVDYAREVPSLTFAERGNGRNDITIRGLSVITGVATVGYYLDGISTELNFQSPDPKLYDIQRVEILRGPQGTLYGAGAVGGLIRMITNPADPSGFDAKADVDYYHIDNANGSYNLSAMVNIPLIQNTLALRVVGLDRDIAGWIDAPLLNEKGANYERDKGLRASLRWIPTDNFDATLRWYYQEYRIGIESFTTPQQAVAAGYSANDISLVSIPSLSTYEQNQFSLDLRYDMKWAVLEWVSGYNRTTINDTPDGLTFEDGSLNPYMPATQYEFPLYSPYKTYSSELRLVSAEGRPWVYTTGLYFKKTDLNETAALPAFGESINYVTDDKQFAVFGEVGYRFNDAWMLTVGGRYLRERLSASTVTSITGLPDMFSGNNGEENAFSPKFVLQYNVDKNLMYYASIAKGIRSGGVNVQIVQDPNFQPTYKSDTAWNYELGTKALWNEQRTELNAAVYYINWSNLQIDGIPTNPALGFVTNAGRATSKGIEAEFHQVLARGLKASLGGAYIDAKIDDAFMGAPAGSRMPNVPRYTLNAALDYDFPLPANLSGSVRAEYSYRDGSFNNLPNLPLSDLPTSNYASGYGLGNLRATVNAAHWHASIYVENVGNTVGSSFANYDPAGLDQFYMTRPRTVGVQVGANLK